jgi:hypothetical protein
VREHTGRALPQHFGWWHFCPSPTSPSAITTPAYTTTCLHVPNIIGKLQVPESMVIGEVLESMMALVVCTGVLSEVDW